MALPDGRKLGYAEFGDLDGRLVLWFHGTPGGRRQIPQLGRRVAAELGIHLVCVERPGVGWSTNHRYQRFAEWAPDAAAVADHFRRQEFAVIGLSGGGPFALACAHELPHRVVACGLLGSVCPIVGPDVPEESSVVHLSARFRSVIEPLRVPLGRLVWFVLQPIVPTAHLAYQGYARTTPAGDQAVFADPEIEAMFIDDLVTASAKQFGAVVHDVALFGHEWGFSLRDIDVPVRWWHGDADNLVPFSHAVHCGELIPDCELHLRPEESHLGGFAAVDIVLEAISEVWDSGSEQD